MCWYRVGVSTVSFSAPLSPFLFPPVVTKSARLFELLAAEPRRWLLWLWWLLN